jgi:hypothetical protein
MIISIGDFEDRRAIKNRLNDEFALLSVLAPQLQLTTVFVLPVFI